jgi:hypothetical protein
MTIPTLRSLLICWAVLMAMTIILLVAGDPTDAHRLPLWSVGLLLGVAMIKARQILWVFLDLRRSTTMWKATFLAFVGAILAIVLGFAGLALAING